jgi:hypothetical protein
MTTTTSSGTARIELTNYECLHLWGLLSSTSRMRLDIDPDLAAAAQKLKAAYLNRDGVTAPVDLTTAQMTAARTTVTEHLNMEKVMGRPDTHATPHYRTAVTKLDTALSRAAAREMGDCTCVEACNEDPATACGLSGRPHTHPASQGPGFGPCPVHPGRPGDH